MNINSLVPVLSVLWAFYPVFVFPLHLVIGVFLTDLDLPGLKIDSEMLTLKSLSFIFNAFSGPLLRNKCIDCTTIIEKVENKWVTFGAEL